MTLLTYRVSKPHPQKAVIFFRFQAKTVKNVRRAQKLFSSVYAGSVSRGACPGCILSRSYSPANRLLSTFPRPSSFGFTVIRYGLSGPWTGQNNHCYRMAGDSCLHLPGQRQRTRDILQRIRQRVIPYRAGYPGTAFIQQGFTAHP